MSRSSDSSLRGHRVLLARPARVLVSCWALGLLVGTLGPSSLRELLRRSADAVRAAPALPTVATPPAPSPAAPRRAGPTATPTHPAKAGPGQPIEDPSRSLAHFARALASAKGRGATHPVRVLHYGDSQIDLDYVSGQLRTALQRAHGDGGFGYTPALRPWRWFYQPGLVHSASPGWTLHRIAGAPRPDGHLGLGLAAVSLGAPKGWIRVASAGLSSLVELAYLAQPGGGTVSLWVKGRAPVTARTASRDFHPAYLTLRVPDGKHVVQVSARGRVRLLGLVFERERGLTWENLPMLSARFHRLVTMNGQLWKAQLVHRAPALVVFQYGANDAISYGGHIETYRQRIEQVLRWRREALPQSSCLVIGPLDQVERKQGALVPRRAVGSVIAAQRAAATAAGCAFWDARQAMGGPGSLQTWLKARRLRHDLVHLNPRGARELARLLLQALNQALDHALAGQRRNP